MWMIPKNPALQEMATKDRILAAIFLWINKLPEYLYQKEAVFPLRRHTLQFKHIDPRLACP